MADTGPEAPAAAGWRRRLVPLAVVAAVLAGLLATARSAERATVADVLEVPDLATVRADRLANGTPVFVVAQPGPDGVLQLDVIQAFVPEQAGPVTGLVGWCAAADLFVDPHHGALYDDRGRRLPSWLAGRERPSVVGGPRTALDDLIHRTAEVAEGDGRAGSVATVGGVQALQPWQVAERPQLPSAVPPDQCRVPEDPPLPDPDRPPAIPTVVDHSFLAARVDPDRSGWQVTSGYLAVDGDGAARWCDTDPGPPPGAACDAPRPDVVVGEALAAALDGAAVGGVGAVLGGPLAVRFADGEAARVAVLPDSVWRGASLRGAERYEGVLRRSWAVGDPTVGVGGMLGDGGCLLSFPGTRVAEFDRVPVTASTVVDVGGATTLAGLDQLDLAAGVPVEVVVDAATCDALALLDP